MEEEAALSVLNFLHLLATVLWIGGMANLILVALPSTRGVLEPAVSGRFIGAVMKRFRLVTYLSIATLILVGIPLTLLNDRFEGLGQLDDSWTLIVFLKHLVVAAMVLMAIYSYEVLLPKVTRLGAQGPSPEMAKVQKLQFRIAGAGFVLGLVVLALTAIVLSIE